MRITTASDEQLETISSRVLTFQATAAAGSNHWHDTQIHRYG
jgi:hypothetical protein